MKLNLEKTSENMYQFKSDKNPEAKELVDFMNWLQKNRQTLEKEVWNKELCTAIKNLEKKHKLDVSPETTINGVTKIDSKTERGLEELFDLLATYKNKHQEVLEKNREAEEMERRKESVDVEEIRKLRQEIGLDL